MGRRSIHTAEELRELILEAATDLIQSAGLAGLSAREIARRIDYSPGTLYNIFENLDDLVLTIEGRLLDRLSAALAEVPRGGNARERVHRLAGRYLSFTQENRKLWNLLFEHHLPPGRQVPPWYRDKLEALMSEIEKALAPLMPDAGPQAVRRSARALWAGVHGITSLLTSDKLSAMGSDSAAAVLDDLVRHYLAGLEALADPEPASSVAAQ
jgi:AcrR family transcriptional regulator